ncbi:YbaB/EbfC family nucleoid-associated protein, partial [Streptomyces tendae]
QMVEARRMDPEARFTGVAGGGLVKATVNAKGTLENLQISPVAADPGNVEALENNILAALREARDAAAASLKAKFAGLADLLPEIPDFTASTGPTRVQPIKSRFRE